MRAAELDDVRVTVFGVAVRLDADAARVRNDCRAGEKDKSGHMGVAAEDRTSVLSETGADRIVFGDSREAPGYILDPVLGVRRVPVACTGVEQQAGPCGAARVGGLLRNPSCPSLPARGRCVANGSGSSADPPAAQSGPD
jgi:hypothetical protein